MSTIKKSTLAVLALGAVIAAAPALYAQDASSGSAAPKTPSMIDHGSMMGGDMGAMKMMENCNRMMQTMHNQSPPTPRETPPATPGQKG